MARHTREALEFLEALTEYIAWRAHDSSPRNFPVMKHVRMFRPYIAKCGVKSRTHLHRQLVSQMEQLARAGEVPAGGQPKT